MGYMRHHAIVVTTYTPGRADEAHSYAEALGCSVTPIITAPVNGYWTFLIGPDGSKEGWDASEQGDDQRGQIVGWLQSKVYADGGSPYSWVEVQYGDDDGDTHVERSSDDDTELFRIQHPDWAERV